MLFGASFHTKSVLLLICHITISPSPKRRTNLNITALVNSYLGYFSAIIGLLVLLKQFLSCTAISFCYFFFIFYSESKISILKRELFFVEGGGGVFFNFFKFSPNMETTLLGVMGFKIGAYEHQAQRTTVALTNDSVLWQDSKNPCHKHLF